MATEGAQRRITDDTLVIDDLATLRAFADPLRHRIIALLDRPRSVRDLAERLERPADRLYYHLRLLEQHGLIQPVEGGNGERRYRASARSISVDGRLAAPHALDGFVGEIFDQARQEWIAAADLPKPDDVKRSMLASLHMRLTEAERQELNDAFSALLAKFGDRDGPTDDDDEPRATYGVMAGMWPLASDDDCAGDDEEGTP
ncbi:MAG TPA: winged helix-turn-helix domain-containing protein [Acidimicrobiales bacterium]|nr:winged helix-turn-helix domain-containing protein [Acidimicrobiales bacterium]